MGRTFCLHFNLAPGDVTVLTALCRDIRRVDPTHRVFVECRHGDLLRHNPDAVRAGGVVQAYPDAEHVKVDYGAGLKGQNRETIHFLAWLHRDFSAKAGFEVPVTEPYGAFHFAPEEAGPVVPGRYWVVMAGGKTDFLAKIWHPADFQVVADSIRAMGLGVVQAGGVGTSGVPPVTHVHPKLDGVVDLVGKTDLREFVRLVRGAEGVVCGVTAAMHVAAALEKPCVVVAGGREAWWWEAYVNENAGFGAASGRFRVPHRFLHAIGLLPCCETHGCWRRGVGDGPDGAAQPCTRQVSRLGLRVPECMDMIAPSHVMAAVASYYADGTLPPP